MLKKTTYVYTFFPGERTTVHMAFHDWPCGPLDRRFNATRNLPDLIQIRGSRHPSVSCVDKV